MKVCDIQELVDKDGLIYLSHGGFLSQALIVGMTESLEKEAEILNINITIANNIFTIFIELSQNMMNYNNSLKDILGTSKHGFMTVFRDEDWNYIVSSQNSILVKDKERIEKKLLEVESLDIDGIRKRYKELRKSGRDAHEFGAGIGFYEIAKRCDKIEHKFNKIDEDRYYFNIKATINSTQ